MFIAKSKSPSHEACIGVGKSMSKPLAKTLIPEFMSKAINKTKTV
jgi:hypothetical protein